MEASLLKQNVYSFLEKPTKIGEQQWEDNTAPLVSISCITYNHEKYIRKAIEGFLLQETNFKIEILIHDDASVDGTADIIRAYEHKYPKLFKPIYQKENQYSKTGFTFSHLELARTQGKYVALCEGDDYWTDPLKLQKQVDFLERNPEFALVCHDAMVINEIDNSSKLFFDSSKKKQVCSTRDTLNNQFCPNASVLFRRKSILPLSNLNYLAQAGDQMLVQLISLDGLLFRMYDVMSVYRQTGSGVSTFFSKNMIRSLENRIDTLNYLNKISNRKYQKYIKIENLLIKNRIDLLKSKSKLKMLVLKFFRIILSVIKKYLTG